jgi:type VI secretion system protein ImpJ
LETLKTQRGIHTAEFGAKDMIFLLAMRSLGRYVPLLFHICREERIHPWSVFGVLRQIIGELSTFSESVSFMGEEVTEESRTLLVPPYRHTNLDESFFAAKAMISRLLDDITAGPEYRIQLLFDGTFYAADLAAKMFKGNNRYFLVLKTEEDPKPLLSNLETAGKLAAREQLPILIAQALPGVRIDHLTLPPQELPRLANAIYFQIHHHSDHWAEVEKRRNLALYWDAAPEDLEAELMIVGRS